LVKRAIEGSLDQIRPFLTYADSAMPTIAEAIRKEFVRNSDALVKRAVEGPLDQIPSFLAYADTAMPTIAEAIRGEFAANSGTLVRRVIEGPLDQIPPFLTYADAAMPTIAATFRRELSRNFDTLAKRALMMPLEHLASFLAHAGEAMSSVGQELRQALLSERLAPAMAERAVQDGPAKLVALFRFDRAFSKVLSSIESTTWAQRWKDVRLGQPHWFIGFASTCYHVDQDGLVGPIAEAIIRNARADDFSPHTITIRHLSFVLSSPHRCTAAEIDEFVARCISADWLAKQYLSPDATIGALAGSVRAAALDERGWIRPHFRHSTLLERVETGAPRSSDSPRYIAEWLQLFCATQLLGGARVTLPPAGALRLSEAIKVILPGPPDVGVQPMQASLWAGMRELCHLSGRRPTVDAAIAEGILAQFRAAKPVGRPRLAALNAIMIGWLERCRDQGWRLVVERDSIVDALEHQLAISTSTPASV
jgi:hypothetical protein